MNRLVYLINYRPLEGFRDLGWGGQVSRTVKYADDLVLLAKEETALQCMFDRLTETGRRYGLEMNVWKKNWESRENHPQYR